MSDSDEGDGGGKGAPKRPPGRRAKPPVTIDLSAEPAAPADPPAPPADSAPPEIPPPTDRTDAPPESPAAAPETATAPAPERPRVEAAPPRPVSPIPPRTERPKTDWSSAGRLIAAGVFGGALATVLGILYHASGIIPTRADLTAADAVRQAQATAEKVATFENRLAALEQATAPLAALAEKVASLEKLEDTNRSRIENLENAMPVAGGGGDGGGTVAALGPIETRLAAAEASITTLGDRVGALTGRVEEIAARPPPAVESERAARAIAIGLLRQGAESGMGFAADLAMLRALGLDGDDVAALEPLAKDGAPTVATLQASFPAVADAILAAAAAPGDDAGFVDRLLAFGSGLVTVRPTAPIAGDTPAAVVSRMQAAVARGDLQEALGEREKLPPAAQDVSATWAGAAADRVAIDTIVERLALSVTPPAN
jgi:hypothetical protein